MNTSPITKAHLQQLNTLNQQGIGVIGELKNLLNLEFDALSKRDIEQIQTIIQQKTEVLKQLETNSQERNNLFAQLQIPANKQGLEQFAAQLPDVAQASFELHWLPLEALLKEVNELNKRNEAIVTRSNKNLDHLMSIIRGQNQKSMLYNNAGNKGNYTAQQRLGKA